MMHTIIALSLLMNMADASPDKEPYSCKMYYEAQKKCSYNTVGKCYVQSEVDRLRQQCARDGGKP